MRDATVSTSDLLYVEWYITYACNYKCSYCFYGSENLLKKSYMYQVRGPKLVRSGLKGKIFALARSAGVLSYADSRQNHGVDEWKRMFAGLARHRRKLYLSFTGGEPLAEERFIVEMLNYLDEIFDEFKVRIDTNGSLLPKFKGLKEGIDIAFNVSHHPTQTDLESFLVRLGELRTKGRVAMVNRVVGRAEIPFIEEEVEAFRARGYFLNVSPDSFDTGSYSAEENAVLARLRSPIDIDNPILNKNIGKSCVYPSFGLVLLPTGYAWTTPCSTKKVNLIAQPDRIKELLTEGAVTCPAACACFHQYSWADGLGFKGIDFIGEYVQRNVEWRARQVAPVRTGE